MTVHEGGGGRLIQRDDCALVVIDMQERLLSAIHEAGDVLRNVLRLVRFARIIGLPVVATEQIKLGPTAPDVRRELPEYDPVGKDAFGCFGCADFVERLDRLGRSTLILAGVEAHVCVLQTALQGLAGHTVHVVADAVSSRAPRNAALALERMRMAGAVITSVESCLFELLARAGTEEFRRVLPLIR